MHLCNTVAWAGQSWFIWVFLSLIRMGSQISSANSALLLMGIVWDVLLLQDCFPSPLMLFCWESLGERACPWQFGWATHTSRKRAAISTLWMLNAIRTAPGWEVAAVRTSCKVCAESVPRSSWTGCWLKPLTPPWFITEIIVCVWFYTGDLWASVLPLHQLFSISDAVMWAPLLSPCQKGTIKDIFKVYAKLFLSEQWKYCFFTRPSSYLIPRVTLISMTLPTVTFFFMSSLHVHLREGNFSFDTRYVPLRISIDSNLGEEEVTQMQWRFKIKLLLSFSHHWFSPFAFPTFYI